MHFKHPFRYPFTEARNLEEALAHDKEGSSSTIPQHRRPLRLNIKCTFESEGTNKSSEIEDKKFSDQETDLSNYGSDAAGFEAEPRFECDLVPGEQQGAPKFRAFRWRPFSF